MSDDTAAWDAYAHQLTHHDTDDAYLQELRDHLAAAAGYADRIRDHAPRRAAYVTALVTLALQARDAGDHDTSSWLAGVAEGLTEALHVDLTVATTPIPDTPEGAMPDENP